MTAGNAGAGAVGESRCDSMVGDVSVPMRCATGMECRRQM